ncbi:hypothetical protein [Hymenobacter psoromatis]|uniref:hypothetical protein n=1 Tax=Hymenobacter psoromatis TaxID=1484116 RepID=UPI001CBC934F|nr:hypothetical protein [Hymenobacter psoromatis]
MKSIFAYLLAGLVLLQTFSRELLVADFVLNRAAITQQFCVNKSRPQLHCDGKCYFAKQLKKQEERQSKSAGPLKERLDMLPTAFGGWQPRLAVAWAVPTCYPATIAAAVPHGSGGAIDQPPRG